jgi:hypothetical protein
VDSEEHCCSEFDYTVSSGGKFKFGQTLSKAFVVLEDF